MTQSSTENKQTSYLIAYFLLSFFISIPVFLLYTFQSNILIQLPLLIFGSFTPTISAFIIIIFSGNPGVTVFWKRIWKWHVSIWWYVVTIALPTIVWLIGFFISKLSQDSGTIEYVALVSFPVIFLANLGEEIGWRGFALPHLLNRYNPITSSLILGFIWACFHIALYWQRPFFAFLIFPLLVVISMIMTWLYLGTKGGVVICTVFHAVFNTWGQAILPGSNSEKVYIYVIFLLGAFMGIMLWRYKGKLYPSSVVQLTKWTSFKVPSEDYPSFEHKNPVNQ